MSEVAIRVENLSKLYHIGARPERYKTLRDTLANTAKTPARLWRKAFRRDGQEQAENTIWALKNINLQVKRGEVVGIIGRNGAGKSTLLKILSRIAEPTEGYAEIHGRVGSLLEVGTGFHLELTGRENIFLNGAILGMRREEILRRFDAIVDFAEVEKFIDTPVKHYSSGMYLRLAFAVAAHLEPEILMVDEVLAVGDAAFQKKCLGKMKNVAGEGRTVLFVSHNLGAIRELCNTSLVLDNGTVVSRSSVAAGLACYSKLISDGAVQVPIGVTGWRKFRFVGGNDAGRRQVAPDEPIALEALLEVPTVLCAGYIICMISDSITTQVIHNRVPLADALGGPVAAGLYRVELSIPPLWLAPGDYTVAVKLWATNGVTGGEERHISERLLLEVSGDQEGLSGAALNPNCTWRLLPLGLRDRDKAPGHRKLPE